MRTRHIKYHLLILSIIFSIYCFGTESKPLVIELHSGERIVKSPALIDSITFDVVSLDSAGIPLPIQQIWEGGKSTDILTSEIANVEFKDVPTIYKENVILLEGDVYNSLISCANDTVLYFNAGVKKCFTPKVGLMLATLNTTEKLPIGFIGKIEKFNLNDGIYEVTCTRGWYTDIFESFYGVFDSKSYPDKKEISRAIDVSHRTINLPTIKHTFDFSAKEKLDEDEFFGATGKITVEQKNLLNVRTAVLVEPGARMSMSSILTSNCELSEELSLCHNLRYSKEIPILEQSVKIPVAPLIQVYFSGGIDFKVQGQLGVKAEVRQKYKVLSRIYMSNYDVDTGDNSITIVPIENTVDNIEAFGNIEMSLGVYGELGVAIAKPGIADIGFKYENGIQFKLEAPITKTAIENASRSTELYDLLTGKDNISLSRYSGFAISSDLLKTNFWQLYLSHTTDKPFLTASLLPTFHQLNLNTLNESGELQLEGLMRRSMFSGTPRLAIFKKNEDGTTSSDYVDIADFIVAEESINETEKKISNVSLLRNRNYIGESWLLYPVVQLFGYNVLANPEIPLDEIHVKASDFKIKYKNTLKSYDKTSKTIYGNSLILADIDINNFKLQDKPVIDTNVEWGICVKIDRYKSSYSDKAPFVTHKDYHEYAFKPLKGDEANSKLVIEDLICEAPDFKQNGNALTSTLYLSWGYYVVPSWADGDDVTIYPVESGLPVDIYVKPKLNFTNVSYSKAGNIYNVTFKANNTATLLFNSGFNTIVIPYYVYNWNHPGWNSFFAESDIYYPEPNSFIEYGDDCFAKMDGEFSGKFRISAKGCLLENKCDAVPRGTETVDYYHDTKYSTTIITNSFLKVIFCIELGSDRFKSHRLFDAEHIYCEMRERYKWYLNKISNKSTNTILSSDLKTEIRHGLYPIRTYVSGNHLEYVYVRD